MKGDGKIHLRGKTYHGTYYGPRANGTWGKIRESFHTDDKDVAKRKLRDRVRQAKNARDGVGSYVGPEQRKILFGALLDQLDRDWRQRAIKSLEESRNHLKQVRKALGKEKALAITRQRLEDYIDAQLALKLAPATVNRRLEVIGKAFRLAKERGLIGACPSMPHLGEDNQRMGFLEAWQFEGIAGQMEQPFQDVARFCYLTAWRRGEALRLSWAEVDRASREIRLRTSKNGRPRTIPMHEPLAELIERRWQARQFTAPRGEEGLSALVFHTNGRPVASTSLWKAWTAACRAAELPGVLFHDLRRSGARDMIRAGVAQSVAMRISGHKTAAVFTRYDITSDEDKRSALEQMEAYRQKRAEASNVARFQSPNGRITGASK
jgi:integrase